MTMGGDGDVSQLAPGPPATASPSRGFLQTEWLWGSFGGYGLVVGGERADVISLVVSHLPTRRTAAPSLLTSSVTEVGGTCRRPTAACRGTWG